MNKSLPIRITATCTACGATFELSDLVPSYTDISNAGRRRPEPPTYHFDLREREYHDAHGLEVTCRCGNSFYALREEDFDQLAETGELPFE